MYSILTLFLYHQQKLNVPTKSNDKSIFMINVTKNNNMVHQALQSKKTNSFF